MIHRQHANITFYSPQYEWAFDETGLPVPIAHATHGEAYFCPLCGERMIARLGGVKRHHFAHEERESRRYCSPAEVVYAAAGRWLVYQFEHCLAARQTLSMTWTCAICQQPHAANLLDGVTQARQDYRDQDVQADVALLDAQGKIRAALLVKPVTKELLYPLAQREITTLSISMISLRRHMLDLPTLLKGATIHVGTCTTRQEAARLGVIADQPTLRTVLCQMVSVPPYRFYGPLENFGSLTHVLNLGDRRLWLPPILWERAIGGVLHPISAHLQIISQEWPQDDGGTIALYYVTVRDQCAIALRRFAVDQPPYARLGQSGVFNTARITAFDVAHSLAEG
jgi:hypothetical protein